MILLKISEEELSENKARAIWALREDLSSQRKLILSKVVVWVVVDVILGEKGNLRTCERFL